MTLINILFIGFFIGLKHALEADHVAAVATLVSKASSLREGLMLGATWGIGHTITLFIFGSAVLIVDTMIPELLALALEFLVGFMLVIMGGAVIKEIVQRRIHLHAHRNADGITHLHFHSHAKEKVEHQASSHHHNHVRPFSVRALIVGIMHGMAGSAALILLTLDSVSTIGMGLAYILLFGIGSMVGMALLSILIVIPLRSSKVLANRIYKGLRVFIGAATLFIGMIIIYESSIASGILA